MAEASLNLVQILTRTESWLRERGIDSPRLEAELLLCHVLGIGRLQIYLLHDRPITEEERAALRPLLRRRGEREPLAWILGSKGFHNIDLIVHTDVLVPRADTETLVEATLEWCDPQADPLYFADVGCGTGAIGLALAHALPGARIYAIDQSPQALQNTRDNVSALGLEKRVAVLKGDLLSAIPLPRPVDWVVSNPPYIPHAEIPSLMPEVSQHEPVLALDGGNDGLDVYRRLIPVAAKRARKGVLLEVGQGQSVLVMEMLRKAGLGQLQSWTDLGGVQRVVGGCRV